MVPGPLCRDRRADRDRRRLGAAGAGTFGMNSDFEDEAARVCLAHPAGKETGRPVWFLLTDRPTDPQRWRRIMAGVHQARAAGASVTAQVAGRPVGVILGVATSLNPFAVRERYKPFESLPLAERLVRLRDPAVRAGDPRRPAVAGSAGPFRAARAVRRGPVGPHVRDGRPARLRAARRDQRRRDRSARRTFAGRGRLRLSDRGCRRISCSSR